MELDNDLREPFAGDRAQFVDAADRVDHFFDGLGDLRLHLLRPGSRESGRHRDHRHIDLREEVQGQAFVGKPAGHHQTADQHGGEDRAADTHVGENHWASAICWGWTVMPSARRSSEDTATVSCSLSPSAISTRPSCSTPDLTSREETVLSVTTKMRSTPAKR